MSWDKMEDFLEMTAFVRSRINKAPKFGIILGTSLGGLADEIKNPISIPYDEIPGFPQSTAPSHAGLMNSGELAGRDVLGMSGRFHYYEGYSFTDLAKPIRLFKLLGVDTVIITNMASGILPEDAPLSQVEEIGSSSVERLTKLVTAVLSEL